MNTNRTAHKIPNLESVDTSASETLGKPKSKKVQRWAYDPEKVTVYVAEITSPYITDRKVAVWDAEGRYLGNVESYESQTSRHLFGNVASFGKVRMFWHAEGSYYGTDEGNASMAAAIRDLLQ